jgi:hypothetical protein
MEGKMDPTQLRGQLADLFRTAGRAHHLAFAAVNGEDPEWPLWYAGYLYSKMTTLLGNGFTVEQLAALLVAAEDDRKAHAPGADWPTYYADFFLGRPVA